MDYRRLKHFARINYKDIRDRKQSDLSVNRKSQTANIYDLIYNNNSYVNLILNSYAINFYYSKTNSDKNII